MVEAGAYQVPEDTLLQASSGTPRDRKLCEAQEELRERAGKPKWLDPSRWTCGARAVHGSRYRRADRDAMA